MKYCKVIAYDLHQGLGRKRYLALPLLVALPLIGWVCQMYGASNSGTMGDCLASIWMGQPPIQPDGENIVLPIIWMLSIIGTLYFNLDYLINDLTQFGQQIVFRIDRRKWWFLSKSLWCFAVCTLYFLVCLGCALVAELLVGGEITLRNTPEFLLYYTGQMPPPMTVLQCLVLHTLLPWLAVTAFNMVEMTLCLFVKPVLSFLATVLLVALTVFWSSPFFFGNAAMVVRSGMLQKDGLSPVALALSCVAVILVCIVVGCVRFERMDILDMEK